MKEHPIIFNAEMVRAILAGKKTQTRRVINPQPQGMPLLSEDGEVQLNEDGEIPFRNGGKLREINFIKSKYGQPGDKLWVRETWGEVIPDKIVYRANHADDYQWGAGKSSQGGFQWKPSIYMPRLACRITLKILDIRIERLQIISAKDVLAEGVKCLPKEGTMTWGLDSIRRFMNLWDSIHSKDGFSWETNPWVWVIEFKRVRK